MVPFMRLVSVLSDSQVHPENISFQLYRTETRNLHHHNLRLCHLLLFTHHSHAFLIFSGVIRIPDEPLCMKNCTNIFPHTWSHKDMASHQCTRFQAECCPPPCVPEEVTFSMLGVRSSTAESPGPGFVSPTWPCVLLVSTLKEQRKFSAREQDKWVCWGCQNTVPQLVTPNNRNVLSLHSGD